MSEHVSEHVGAVADPPRYEFAETWRVDASESTVYDVLADLASYPQWWPQVRSVVRVDDDTARVVCRSLLPYSLRFDMVRVRDDRGARVLEARLFGDLDGWARWTVRATANGSVLLYEQQVTTPGRLLRTLARGGRSVLVLNHAWMMRSGRRGLRRRLLGAASATA
jgi:Polyketide cyclase / dehydrase and lipid transport